jgi:hypothetical protein
MAASSYADLCRHVGHEINCVRYGDDVNVAVECETCHEIILTFDKEEDETQEQFE